MYRHAGIDESEFNAVCDCELEIGRRRQRYLGSAPPWWRCNAFGFALDDASVRRAAVEGVPETVIAAIYLLHERSVGEIAAKLRPDELEHVIGLVGRCPSCYPPGALDDLKSRRAAPVTPLTGTLNSEADLIGVLAHDLDRNQRDLGDLLAGIPAVGEDPLDEREDAS